MQVRLLLAQMTLMLRSLLLSPRGEMIPKQKRLLRVSWQEKNSLSAIGIDQLRRNMMQLSVRLR